MKKFLFLFIIISIPLWAQLDYTTSELNYYIHVVEDTDSLGISRLSTQTIDGSVTVGEVCEFTSSGWDEADASAEATADGILGIYLGSNVILINGVYTTTGLTAGTIYWLSETEGQWTSTKPTTGGTILKAVGQALSTTQLLVSPNIWAEN